MVLVFNFASWEISDFDFSISGHFFLYKSRYFWVLQNQCRTFPPFFIVLLYSVIVCDIGIFCWSSLDFLSCVNLFIGMFYSLPYFNHRAVLSFWTGGDSCLEGLSITTTKSTPGSFLEKPSTTLLMTGVLSSRITGEEFVLLLNSVSAEMSLNGVVLVGNFFFRDGAAKSPVITSFYLVFQWF